MDELTVGIEEAARRLGIGRSQMYELVMSGQIPSLKVGKRRLVAVQSLQEWVDRELLAVKEAVTEAARGA